MTAILNGWLWVPREQIHDLATLRATLTFTPRHFGGPGEEPPRPIPMFDDRSSRTHVGVPRAFGLQMFSHLPLRDDRVDGARIVVPRLPDPHHPRVKDPEAQARFMADLHRGMLEHETMLASAPTGSGKTVCALRTAAVLGHRTLILVHLERLMHQWIEEIESKLGVPRARIGLVQQDKCEWRDKDFSVGLLHSVVRRDYGEDFHRAFGTVIFDEVHKVGSEFFAPAVHKFPAKYKLGLSATIKRKDGGDKVFGYHLGPVRVSSRAEALPMKVYVVKYQPRQKVWGSNHGSLVKCVSMDPNRNALIAQAVKRFHDAGRQTLVVSESVAHLQKLMAMSEALGVPRAVMGQYTSEAQRSFVDVVTKKKKVVKTKQSKVVLDHVKAKAQIIFATYGMMTEGVDIPRLDAGIDATPRSAATQLIGRIRRPMPGKRTPLWITLRDVGCPTFERYFINRCKDYNASNAEVVNYGTKENRAHTTRN